MAANPRPATEPDPLEDARECLQLEQDHREAVEHDWLWQLRKAVLLSPTIDVCEALLRGEQVPLSRLDPNELKRRRRRAA